MVTKGELVKEIAKEVERVFVSFTVHGVQGVSSSTTSDGAPPECAKQCLYRFHRPGSLQRGGLQRFAFSRSSSESRRSLSADDCGSSPCLEYVISELHVVPRSQLLLTPGFMLGTFQ